VYEGSVLEGRAGTRLGWEVSMPIDAASVLGKVRIILESLEELGPSTLTGIASAADLPKPTVHRIAKDLTDWGLVERQGDVYRLGLRLFELGIHAPRGRQLSAAARAAVRQLALETGETVHLGVLAGTRCNGGEPSILYLDKVAGATAVRLPTRSGGRMPVHCTALGRALLVGFDEDEVRQFVADGLRRVTRHTIASPRRFLETVRAARDEGYAIEREESLLGVACVGAPIRDPNGAVVGALSLAAPSGRLQQRSAGRRVLAAAEQISHNLATAA
jgi:DNA-binding IclR family transcriptional regulator